MTAFLQVKSVSVGYGETEVVHGVNLELRRGEFFGILGASGCGKSTLLGAIAGVLPLRGGQVVLEGEDITGVSPSKRNIGMVFQEPLLFAGRSVSWNVEYGLRARRVSHTERDQRVRELLGRVELSDYAQARVETLSGGQAHRVALARALAPRPRVLLCDEPLSALDARLKQRLLEQLPEILDGVTCIYVTHDARELRGLADRVAVMETGSFIAEGSLEQLAADPGAAPYL